MSGPIRGTASFSSDKPIVVTEEITRAVWRLLEEHVAAVSVKATFAHGVTKEFDSIDALLAEPNPPAKSIEGLEFNTGTDGYGSDPRFLTAKVRLGRSFGDRLTVSVAGNDASRVEGIRDKLHDVLEGTSADYPWLARRNGGEVGLIFYLTPLIFALLLLLGLWVSPRTHAWITNNAWAGLVASVLSSVIGFYLSGPFLKRLQENYFPQSVFALGQGKARFEKMASTRQWVVRGICGSAVATFIGLLSWVITQLLGV